MAQSWLLFLWEASLAGFVGATIMFALVLLTLPSRYDPYREERLALKDFDENDQIDPESGFRYLIKGSETDLKCKPSTSVVIFVLGDIGRSPRMQYHATSIAKYGGKVDLVGYHESEVLPEIKRSKLINVVPLEPLPARLRTDNKALFVLLAPLKVLFQAWTIYYTLGYKARARKYMLVQNPPSIPSLLIAQLVCYIRNTRLVIDWHNLGHTILALKLGPKHPLVKISEWYENVVAKFAQGHISVSRAMAKLLTRRYGIEAVPLHDRPARQFQPLSAQERRAFLSRLEQTAKHVKQFESHQRRLVVSSTSWTADEDFSILLDALKAYSATVSMESRYPKLTVIITGKGPLKNYYFQKIEKLEKEHRLTNVKIHLAWLSMADYALLLGSADLGVSLHTSSSGVDLPMKVVDMFGAGLPVVGWDDFEAWPELVKEGINGRGFKSADGLERLLEELLPGRAGKLAELKEGAMFESQQRWEHEWPKIARLFGILIKDESSQTR
ncbi:glycosyltransferase family 33 protein [Myriangium duriaei CBS 260.36]|uniref:Chitobiosyldiphosphodolichol beta-mannosyltransferase n=1 Tax=Myriangium duriaei CBS 260.36 TaxID=1168546 RepID=A0A9P4MK45_9PEZI|nr:glycosyltransferase family 33 protein [Myriangium duriaei CBS 260.36]